jgi:uncharacterized membrane protein
VQALHVATLAGPGTLALAQALDCLCSSVIATSVTPDASSSGSSSVAAVAAVIAEADRLQSVTEELPSQALLGDG